MSEISKNIKSGQWIFTCSMKPLQFSKWKTKDPKNYGISEKWNKISKKEKLDFLFDDFETIDGSHHSRKNCSLKLVSDEYAKWFIKNECWNLFDKNKEKENCWELYELEIKNLSEKDGITFEGY